MAPFGALLRMTSINEAVGSFLDHRRRKNVSPDTLRLYTRVLTHWQTWRTARGLHDALSAVELEDFTAFLGALLADEKAPNTVDSYRRILRAFWRYQEGEGALSPAQCLFWANHRIPRPLGTDPEPRPYCEDDQFEDLLAAAGDGSTENSARNRAILLLLWESGMRAGELCGLTDAQLDTRKRRAMIIGKGRKRAWVFWGPRAGAALLRYLALRRGGKGGALAVFRGVSSRNNGGPLTPNAVRLMVKALGVKLPNGAPVHFIRHAFAHRNLDAGLETSQVQQLMRHANIETTLRYLKERPDRLQDLHRRGLGLGKPSPAAGQRREGEG